MAFIYFGAMYCNVLMFKPTFKLDISSSYVLQFCCLSTNCPPQNNNNNNHQQQKNKTKLDIQASKAQNNFYSGIFCKNDRLNFWLNTVNFQLFYCLHFMAAKSLLITG